MVGEEIRQSPRSYEFGHGGPFPHYSRHMCVYTHIGLVIILLGYSSPLAHIYTPLDRLGGSQTTSTRCWRARERAGAVLRRRLSARLLGSWSMCLPTTTTAPAPQTTVSNDLLGATASRRSYWVIPRCLRLSLPVPQGSLSASANHPLYEAPFPDSLHARRAGTESPQ
jgi:hypothetical protein